MKKKRSRRVGVADADTMRAEYDFSRGVRGATVARYRKGNNLVLIDPDVLDVFPDAQSVNDALKALVVVIRNGRRSRTGKRSA